jgi:hypothetical protein
LTKRRDAQLSLEGEKQKRRIAESTKTILSTVGLDHGESSDSVASVCQRAYDISIDATIADRNSGAVCSELFAASNNASGSSNAFPLETDMGLGMALSRPDLLAANSIPESRNGVDGQCPNQYNGMHFQSLADTSLLAPSIPMDSYVRVRRFSFHAACVQNALLLGISFARILAHTCGDSLLPSPWFSPRPYSSPESDFNTAGQQILATAPDLSPTQSQFKHAHDLYLDCLPFPELREKVLVLQAGEPQIFDEDEFVRDLDYRDAMQCWGPTPWESRSWEVQVWFLKKWWMITGGEQGEMAMTSKWWRMFRGESA